MKYRRDRTEQDRVIGVHEENTRPNARRSAVGMSVPEKLHASYG